MVVKMVLPVIFFFQVLLLASYFNQPHHAYDIDDTNGLGRQFDGIGAISGGGATSRLLVSYAEPYRSQILDYLFKPNFGASLHIFKVEIGGDAQSSDGSEPSHMHSSDDENYYRGYEWWLMKEAKKRNPDIKLYGLPWTFPGWIGNGTTSPYANPQLTAWYVTKWIQGAKQYHNLMIDYIGIWNERLYNITYVETLRKTLDSNGLNNVKIVASDSHWGIVDDLLKDKVFFNTVDIVGVHYTGTLTVPDALKTNKPLWSSEDYSTFNDNVGGGCWARLLNQNYVNGHMTSTISWNLIASYYDKIDWERDGLMTAIEPWSGHYEVASPIYVTAHTSQFTKPGWYYYPHGHGVSHLDKGGSFVALTNSKDLTVVIETMSHDHSICVRPPLPKYTVDKQNATFQLKGSFAGITELFVWYTKLGFNGDPSKFFEKQTPIKVVNGTFSLLLGVDELYTLTTLSVGHKGQYPNSPASEPFPLPYSDDFEKYAEFSEADYFADQSGVFEIRQSNDLEHGKVMRQVVPQRPVVWCNDSDSPTSIIGNHNWTNVNVSSDIYLEDKNGGVLLASRVSSAGCSMRNARGVFLWLSPGKYELTTDHERWDKMKSGTCEMQAQKWYRASLYVKDSKVIAHLNGKKLFDVNIEVGSSKGWAAIGTLAHNYAQFDNFNIDPTG
ncbi:galactocerebrosidase-like [Saccoglossus kowalevskii]|uniref:galactosylceramidase n=1 Tax=Saccoglossus kowalevskii TaxID=10224 RepID=A0ABM0GQA0_SACKO|nr:PREDICTED: galactocerebrosidase-like [Saccoglossus kowalevskii]